jgi:hypothetical protein
MTELLMKKKKSSTLTKPVTRVTKPTQKSPSVKPVKVKQVKAPRVKPVKVQVRVQQTQQPRQTQQPQQAPAYQNSDFKFMTSVDQAGIAIITNFRGKLIHKFLLSNTDYALFVALHPQRKYDYVRVRVHPNSFWNDMQLVHQVILTLVNVLDTIFVEAQRILRQQEQQQRR